jgi:carbonic anhydrase/acetyltransferase-like protein (isoleucine patch superfamily)
MVIDGGRPLIGIRSVVLSGARIGDWSIVAAGSMITEDTDIIAVSQQ